MSKLQIRFKDPDAISEFLETAIPGSYDDPKVEQSRNQLADKYFEWGDYGCFEVDLKTWSGRLIPKKDWK